MTHYLTVSPYFKVYVEKFSATCSLVLDIFIIFSGVYNSVIIPEFIYALYLSKDVVREFSSGMLIFFLPFFFQLLIILRKMNDAQLCDL